MNYLAIACLVIVTSYTIVTRISLGYLPGSISESWYMLAKKGYSEGFAWCLMLMGLLVIAMPFLYTFKDTSMMILMFAGFFLFCVAIAAPYKMYPFWHYFFTFTTIAAGFTVTILEHWPSYKAFLPLGIVAVIVGVLKLCKVKSLTWWIELTLIYVIIGSLI